MRRIHVFVLFAIAVALNSTIACAVGKQTVDPNSGGSVAASGDAGSDASLSKSVTYYARGKMLYEIVDDLGKLTDTKFYTGRGSSDWRTRELRMNVAAKDMPANTLMQSIARVMRLKWTRGSMDGKSVYRLVGEQTAVEETPEEKAARELAKRRSSFFSQLMGLARASTADIDSLKSGDPELYKLAKTPYGVPVARFLADTPAASMALGEGRHLILRGRDILPSAVGNLLPAMQASAPGTTVQARGQSIPMPHSMAPNTETLVVEINPTSSQGSSSGLGDMKITYNGWTVPITFADPSPPANAANTSTQPAMTQAAKPKPEIKPDPIVDHPDEPDLHKKIKLDLKESPAAIDVVQTALAEASGFAVVSDSFDGASVMVDVPKDEMELVTLLDKISTASGQNWEKRGRTIEMRDRKWASKRESMVSQADLQAHPLIP